MKYSREDILKKCEEAFEELPFFYQKDFVNYRGKTIDTDEYYTEVISEFIIDRIDKFEKGISTISRTQGYDVGHDGSYKLGTGRDEEITAIKMFNQCVHGFSYEHIGQIIDYQTPLKSNRLDRAGKIDLLSFDGKVARILELKKADSDETMLRCVLEGFTYLCTIDKGLLIKSFNLPQDTEVKASPLVFLNGTQWKEWTENRPKLTCLMKLLDSKPYFVFEKDNVYQVTDGINSAEL